MKNDKLSLNFEDINEVKNFIADTSTGVYSGKNIDSEDVIITLTQGEGMQVKTLQSNNWIKVHEYNTHGECVLETYER